MIVNCQLKKSERLTSQLVIDKLFAGGNASMAAFPLRIVFMKVEKEEQSGDAENGMRVKHLLCPFWCRCPRNVFVMQLTATV